LRSREGGEGEGDGEEEAGLVVVVDDFCLGGVLVLVLVLVVVVVEVEVVMVKEAVAKDRGRQWQTHRRAFEERWGLCVYYVGCVYV
jgi:hypothetical protein